MGGRAGGIWAGLDAITGCFAAAFDLRMVIIPMMIGMAISTSAANPHPSLATHKPTAGSPTEVTP